MRKTMLLFFVVLLLASKGFAQVKNVELLDRWTDTLFVQWYGDAAYNEVWGFVQEGEEYAIIGSSNGTNVLKINEDNTLSYLQFIKARFQSAIHRDFHTYRGYMYEVCDQGNSTLRIYDLSYLPDSIHLVYDDSAFLSRAHNIFIDTSSALLYACGVTTQTSSVPLRVLSLSDPVQPSLVYDYEFVDYVHDIYVRNDTAFINAANEGLRVADFSNPTMPLPLGSLEFYTDKGYNHSGWLSEDGKTYVLCDETVASNFKVLDVSDLSDIQLLNYTKPPTFENTFPHNVMFKNGIAYFSYYNDGLQIYDIRNPYQLKRIGYYDTYLDSDVGYRGAWGIYAYLPSGRLLISDRKYGLHLFAFDAPPNLIATSQDFSLYPSIVEEGYTYFYKNHAIEPDYQLEIYDDNGRIVQILNGNTDYLRIETQSLANGLYLFKYINEATSEILVGKFIVNQI